MDSQSTLAASIFEKHTVLGHRKTQICNKYILPNLKEQMMFFENSPKFNIAPLKKNNKKIVVLYWLEFSEFSLILKDTH